MRIPACATAVAFLLVFAAGTPAGAQQRMKIGTSVVSTAVKTATPAALPPTIKLEPSVKSRVMLPVEVKKLSPAFYAAWKSVGDDYTYLQSAVPEFEAKWSLLRAKSKECGEKTYTQQEMTAAGCLPTDTISQCSEKLYGQCIAPYSINISQMALMVYFARFANSAALLEKEFLNSFGK